MTFSEPVLEWRKLGTAAPQGNRLTSRLAFPLRRADLFIAIDGRRRRHFLVELDEKDSDVFERSSRGISVTTTKFNTSAGHVSRFIDIECLDDYGHPALDQVANEIANAIESGASVKRSSLVLDVLAKWRRFWSGVGNGELSKAQQIGLFGELWFLSRWLAPSIGIEYAVNTWRGPFGARNDFENTRIAVEVKTSSTETGQHRIHGIEQLIVPEDGALFLFSLLLREEKSSAVQLPGLVEEIRHLASVNVAIRDKFEEGLEAATYFDMFSSEYMQLKVRLRAQMLFAIKDGFPRLVPSLLTNGVPAGVSNISYDLSVDSAGAYLLATEPSGVGTNFDTFKE